MMREEEALYGERVVRGGERIDARLIKEESNMSTAMKHIQHLPLYFLAICSARARLFPPAG